MQESSSPRITIERTTLGQLWPYANVYSRINTHQIHGFVNTFKRKCEEISSKYGPNHAYDALFKKVLQKAVNDKHKDLHPVNYAAGVLFENGETVIVSCNKLLEYSHSLDAVSKTVAFLEMYRDQGIAPTVLLHCDNYGILHAPTAAGRAHLFEGQHRLRCVVHDQNGKLVELSVADLVLCSLREDQVET